MPIRRDQQISELLSPTFISKAANTIQKYVAKQIASDKHNAFKPTTIGTGPHKKTMALVDISAEQLFKTLIDQRFGNDRVYVLGEESLEGSPDLTNEARTCILVDMVDGTDLLQKGFSNWCSAMVVFSPADKRIDGAFIALRGEMGNWLYYATRKQAGAFKIQLRDNQRGTKRIKLSGPDTERELTDASVCMYAQKSFAVRNLAQMRGTAIVEWLSKVDAKNKELKSRSDGECGFRFYNLAGNPMMARLAEGTIDAVIEFGGQLPHDVAPGAYIATKAGAVLTTPEGERITEQQLADYLLTPSRTKVRYVLAANEALALEILELTSGLKPFQLK